MIETHPNPDKALSDAAQQITPHTLEYILRHLVIRKNYSDEQRQDLELEHLRRLMDTLDAEIIGLLARRMDLSREMGLWKKKANITVFQPDRWREIVESRSNRAMQHNLSKAFILALYELIHHESIQYQLAVLKDETIENEK
jgi:chorismate mutase